MKYPVRKRKIIDIVRIGQQPYTVKEAQSELESRLPELHESRKEVDDAIIEHREATPNFMASLNERASETGKFENFQKAQNYLGGRQTKGEQLRSSFNEMTMPYSKELAVKNMVHSLDEEEGSKVLDKIVSKQEVVDEAEATIKREIFQNRSNAETLNKDNPVLWEKDMEKGNHEMAGQRQDNFIDEAIKLANQSAKKDSEEEHRMKMVNPTIHKELSSFGVKKFPKFKRVK
jgi:hypothetical protein